MRKVRHVLEFAIDKREVLRAARAWRALRQWDEAVGPALAQKSCPDRYEHGTVFVAVEGSTWAMELRMRKDEILARLRSISDEPTLFDKLRFGVRPFEKPVEAEAPVPITVKAPEVRSIREIGERLIEKRRDAGRD